MQNPSLRSKPNTVQLSAVMGGIEGAVAGAASGGLLGALVGCGVSKQHILKLRRTYWFVAEVQWEEALDRIGWRLVILKG